MRGMAILGILYAFSLCAVFVAALVCSDFWRVFPMWMVWISLTTYQAIMVQVLGPWDKDFWLREWMPVEKAVLVFAILAVGEAVRHRSRRLWDYERWTLRFALAVVPFSVVFYFTRVDHGTAFQEFVQWREWIWIWLALTLFATWWYFFFRTSRSPLVIRRHVVGLGLLMLTHAIAAPQLHHGRFNVLLAVNAIPSPNWFTWQVVMRVSTILVCAVWLQNIARLSLASGAVASRRVRPAIPVSFAPGISLCDQSPLHSATALSSAVPSESRFHRAAQG